MLSRRAEDVVEDVSDGALLRVDYMMVLRSVYGEEKWSPG